MVVRELHDKEVQQLGQGRGLFIRVDIRVKQLLVVHFCQLVSLGGEGSEDFFDHCIPEIGLFDLDELNQDLCYLALAFLCVLVVCFWHPGNSNLDHLGQLVRAPEYRFFLLFNDLFLLVISQRVVIRDLFRNDSYDCLA